MAKKKVVEVQKFGGTESLGQVREEGNLKEFNSYLSGQKYVHENVDWDTQSVEAKSQTSLETDEGHGGAAIIRCFEFGMNPVAFAEHRPTRQELFNAHYKGIEVALWRDGLKVLPDVNPRIVVDEKAGRYKIFVGAAPQKGHKLYQQPQTLSQIVHG